MSDPQLIELDHNSPEFDAAYDIISADIAPEYLETRDFLRNRLRVWKEGPKSEQERLLVQDGYTLHLIAAIHDQQVVGAIYGHLISRITDENKSVGFVTYITVHPNFRRRGIGTSLIRELQRVVDGEAIRLTGKNIFGMVYEIEEAGKEGIKTTVSKLDARPLDIVYCQPALRLGYEPEQMNLWLQLILTVARESVSMFTLPVEVVHDLVKNMLAMEYVGPKLKGFDPASMPYTAFLSSIQGKQVIGYK